MTVAIVAVNGADYATGQSLVTLGLMVFAGPFLSRATIRAIRAREQRLHRGRQKAGRR